MYNVLDVSVLINLICTMNFSLVIFISLLNIFLSLLLLINNWKKNKNILFLSSFLVIYSVYGISGSLLNDGGSVWLFAVILNNFAPFYYLFPVLLYFYVRTTFSDFKRYRKTDFLHFIPFIINLIAIIPYLLTSFDYKYSVAEKLMCNYDAYMVYDFKLFYPHIINQVARPLLFFIYLIASGILIIKFLPKLKASTGSVKMQFNFMIVTIFSIISFFLILSLMHIFVAIYQIVHTNPHDTFIYAKKLFRLIANLYFIIPLFILLNPRFLYGLPQNKLHLSSSDNINEIDVIKKRNGIQKSTTLKDDENNTFKLLADKMMSYIEQEKPYLNPEFSVQDICTRLNTPRHHVQYCMNVILNKSFAELKNELRVKYAIELLKSNMSSKISIEGIGKNVGFASASNFFFTFKKITGVTPNQWMTEMKNSKING